jgi:hypothetical protein
MRQLGPSVALKKVVSRSLRSVAVGLSATLLVGTVIGCSRSLYRQKADREVYAAINSKVEALDLTDTPLNPSIDPDPQSRFFDPFNPDHPPMPPDDPLSHDLMKRVDGKKGAANWQHEGQPDAVQNPEWHQSLPRNAGGKVVLNLKNAVHLALLNSRDFQREREDLYLSALDVTFERFRFSPNLALGSTGRGELDGKFRSSTSATAKEQESLTSLTDGSVRWLSATGGELLAGFANSFVWDYNGQTASSSASSLVNFSLVQPLLRLGGRANTLERLTQSERTLLANVRQMEQFQNGFYVRIASGRTAGEGPSRNGIVGASGLGLIAGTPSGRTGAPRADGFLGILEEQQRIENLESNVARLRESLDQLAAAFDAGRISSRLQVDQARQALFNAQSNLLSARAAYETRVDAYKVELGLPPNIPLIVQDSLLARFNSSDPAATAIDLKLSTILGAIRNRDIALTQDSLKKHQTALLKLEVPLRELLAVAQKDLQTLRSVLPVRKAQLTELKQAPDLEDLSIEPERLDPASLDLQLENFSKRSALLARDMEETLENIKALGSDLGTVEIEAVRSRLVELASRFSGLLLGISLNQTATRLQIAVLPPIDLSESKALAVARDNRLDWMNARARLVDSWRQIDRLSNRLQSGLTLTLNGNMKTLGTNQPASFDARTGTLQAGLRFDSPLNRLAERNDYREGQIDYQRARRDLMLFEDRISQSLRNTLRLSNLSKLNFELRRAAVQVAIAQVDLARLRLDEPPKPGATPQFGATTARDLVSALNDLLDAQNDFLSLRVGYDVLRLVLDFELGTIRTDANGLWMDPGSISESRLSAHASRWTESTAANPPAENYSRLTFRQEAPRVR